MEQASGAGVHSGGQPLRGGGTSLNKHYYIRVCTMLNHNYMYVCMYIQLPVLRKVRTYVQNLHNSIRGAEELNP